MPPVPARAPRYPPPPRPADPAALSRAAVEIAEGEGFAAAGVLSAWGPASFDVFSAWIAGGWHAGMAWLERDAALRRRWDSVLPHARALIAVAREVPGRGDGNVARYARGEDYHRVVRRHLKRIVERLRPLAPEGSHFRACVDTAPLLERDAAVRAGVGSLGKNGMLIVPGVGSNVVLGEILTDVALAPTAAPGAPPDVCGTCVACLDACPTRAFVAPRLVDSRRCLSYLTIEHRGPFTPEEEASLGGRLFGCDVCQDVCPWNAHQNPSGPPRGPAASLDAEEIASLTDEEYRSRFLESAIGRATRAGLARNAAAALRREGPA